MWLVLFVRMQICRLTATLNRLKENFHISLVFVRMQYYFNKIAVVTHKEWMHKIIEIEGKLFKQFNMKGFSIDDKDKALEFLTSDE